MFTEKVTPKENLNSMDSMVRGYHGTSPMVEKLVLPYHPSMLLIRSVMEKQCTVIGLKMIPTDHLARYTFATIVTLSNGVPIETVAKCWDIKIFELPNIAPRLLIEKLARIWLHYNQEFNYFLTAQFGHKSFQS